MAVKVINISLPAELLAEIDQLARQEKRTRSELFREAARRYLEVKSQVLSWTASDRRSWAALSESALRRIWDNDKDAAYDNWRPK